MTKSSLSLALVAAVGTALLAPFGADAQQNRGDSDRRRSGSQQEEMQRYRLELPSSDNVILMQADVPKETRVGDSFEYSVRIANVSENIAIHDLKLKVQPQDGLTIESVKFSQSKDKSQSSQQAKSSKQDQSNKSGQQQDAKEQKSNQESQGGNQSEMTSKSSDGGHEVTIKQLQPGESRMLEIAATSEKEGPAQACVAVTSFSPAFCLMTKAVKPELELVKKAPEKAELCDPIEFEYFVKNTGSGDLQSFEITDKLPKGLQTESGDDHLQFTVDGLKAGDVRKFVATLNATEPGEYSSRAVAKTGDGNETRSSKTTTKVEQARLAVAIEGPQTVMVNDPFTYRIRVTNQGNVRAENAKLELKYPEVASLNSTGEIRESDQKVKQEAGSSQPTAANDSGSKQNQKSQQSQKKNQQQSGDQKQSREWDLGSLEPGQTKQTTVTLTAREAKNLQATAIAAYRCGTQDRDWLQNKAMASTEVISIPALLLTVIDNEQKRDDSGKVRYTIVVRNQGTAPDQNLKLTAKLPDGLKFMDGSGETKVEAKGNELTIEPLKELRPDERAMWEVVAQSKSDQQLQVQFRVELTSDSLNNRVSAEEPTTLLPATSQTAVQSTSSNTE